MNQKHKEYYKYQFKPMIEHQDAVLILDSEMDMKYLEKHVACVKANQFLEKLVGRKFKSFDDDDYPIY